MDDRPALIYAIVPLPPPIDGMTSATAVIVRYLSERCELRVLNWSSKRYKFPGCSLLIKSIKIFLAIIHLAIAPRRTQKLYSVANSNRGLYFNILIAFIARLRKMPTYLHHHVFAYVNDYDWRMRIIDQLMGPSGTHIMLCEGMSSAFKNKYAIRGRAIVVPNCFLGIEAPMRKTPVCVVNEPFVLGHLSNLTIDKGIGSVARLFESLVCDGFDVQLVIAGPCVDNRSRSIIEKCILKNPSRVIYLGAVSGCDKWAFFDMIDTFIFPTLYRNEAQPLVLVEACAMAKPCVAYDRGCIASQLGKSGKVVASSGDFLAESSELIKHWIRDRDAYETAVSATKSEFSSFNTSGMILFNRFLDEFGEKARRFESGR